jgi:AraC-like DNA-binding protein
VVVEPVLDSGDLQRLGRLCSRPDDSGIVAAPPFPGIERIGVRIFGEAYAPHRHDTYGIGLTLQGVQAFTYRGARRYSTPGKVLVLHPDELHDGAAATDDGLSYRMLYVEPALLRRALRSAGASLPFVRDAVIDDSALRQTLVNVLADLDDEMDGLLGDQLIAELADGLCRHAGHGASPSEGMPLRHVERGRDFLHENALRRVRSDELEVVTGLDRFALARHFRRLYGTSPHRYLVMRRLHHARGLIHAGLALADVAAAAGFADQSHFSRHFKKAFGMTPGRWRGLSSGQRPRRDAAGE